MAFDGGPRRTVLLQSRATQSTAGKYLKYDYRARRLGT
jgi:hypothetical protein